MNMPKDRADELLDLGWRRIDDPSGGEKWIDMGTLHFLEVDEFGTELEVTVYRWRSRTGPEPHTFGMEDRRWMMFVEDLT